jgi:glucosamine 6-phosphate synthetase-like amidotransferase/phosphosugar isomerase protein
MEELTLKLKGISYIHAGDLPARLNQIRTAGTGDSAMPVGVIGPERQP